MIFSTHVIAHAERLCERIAIIAGGKVPLRGLVAERARPASAAGPAQDAASRRRLARAPCRPMRGATTASGISSCPKSGIEPLLKALIDGGAGIEELSIERPGLHDAFVAIAGEAARARDGRMSRSACGDAA